MSNTKTQNINTVATSTLKGTDNVFVEQGGKLRRIPVSQFGSGGSGGVYVTPQQYGAKGDGVTDDTAAINECLASNSLVYIPNGTYLIDAAIGVKPKSKQTVQLDANATLKGNYKTTAIDGTAVSRWQVINCNAVENVVICGGIIEGDKDEKDGDTSSDQKHGISINNSKNITVEDCRVHGFRGDGMLVATSIEANMNTNIKIAGCEIFDCLRHGITVAGVDGLLVKDVEIHDCNNVPYGCAIDIELHDAFEIFHNITLDGVKTYNTSLGIQNSPGESSGKFQNYVVRNCDIERICHNFDADLDIHNSKIGKLVYSSPNRLRVYDSKIVENTAFEDDFGACYFYNCFFASADIAPISFTSTIKENAVAEVTFDRCTFETAVTDGSVDTTKALVYASASPKKVSFDSCNIYLNNPACFGGVNSAVLDIANCYIRTKCGYATNTSALIGAFSHGVFVNNVFDITDAPTTTRCWIAINATSYLSLKMIGNTFIGNGAFAGGIWDSIANTEVVCINNVMRDYTAQQAFGDIQSTVSFTNIGNITADTTA